MTKNDPKLQYREESILYTMQFNGIPKRFLSAHLNDFPFFEYKEDYCSYFIFGANGVGKTRLLCAIGRHHSAYKRSNLDWRFTSAPKLLFDIRQCYNKEDAGKNRTISEVQLVDLYSHVDLLLLDDLGAEKTSEWSLQTLYLILNNRYENELITIISSNHPYEELNSYIGDRIASRIAEMCQVVELKGRDRRIK